MEKRGAPPASKPPSAGAAKPATVEEPKKTSPVTAQISTALEVTALRFVSDTPVYGRFIIGSTLITPENAAQFYFPNSPF